MTSAQQKEQGQRQHLLLQHPAALKPRFHRIIKVSATLAFLQLLWGGAFFYVGSKRPNIILLPGEQSIDIAENRITTPEAHQRRPVLYEPTVIYAIYAGLHALYVLIACGMSAFLASRGWLTTGLVFSMVPGPGLAFGLIQAPLSWRYFKETRQAQWDLFFQWQARLQSGNDLTPGKRPQK
ncbi:MAG: hypothetical protein KDK37_03385 [Leptospiraceae bacterium]|nr:hypothetical protein [Leptospiraceae bacterium]MCB1303288.1 hypothetical protein [Leptospiraceae bacterium]